MIDGDDIERELREEEYDRDAVYRQGYNDCQSDMRKSFKKELAKYTKLKQHQEILLRDPEKLIELALSDQEINEAITTAVVGMILVDPMEEDFAR